jgi:glutaconate CoA-transferase subunit B
VTDLCIMEPDVETRELVVTSLHPGVTAEAIQAQCAWKLRFSAVTPVTPMPTDEELDALRSLQERIRIAHGAND